jgi:hypothetical protein
MTVLQVTAAAEESPTKSAAIFPNYNVANVHCMRARKRFISARFYNRWLLQTAVDAKRQRRKLNRQVKVIESSAALQTD